MHDRGGRLRGPRSCELALGGERNARDTRTPVARRLADEQERRHPRATRDRQRAGRAASQRRLRPCRSCTSRPIRAAAIRSMSERISIRTLTDGGQQPLEIAHAVAAFLDGAERTLELAQYDFMLGPETAAVVGDAIRRAAARGVAIRFAYNVDHALPVPVPPPPEADAQLIASLPVSAKADRRDPRPDAPQVRHPGRPERVDRLAELDRRLVVAAGERRRGRRVGGAREGLRAGFRAAVDDGRRDEERLRRPALGRRAFGPGSRPATATTCRRGSRR